MKREHLTRSQEERLSLVEPEPHRKLSPQEVAKLEASGAYLENDGCPVEEEMNRLGLPSPSLQTVREMTKNIARSVTDDATEEAIDMVHLPPHYAQFEIEPIRFITENLGPTFLIGNVIKYVMRYKQKNGVEDCKKAMRYAEMLWKFERKDPDWWR